MLHPSGRFSDSDPIPKAWLRPSQIKINYPPDEPPDKAMLIVDVLRCAKMKSPTRLSAETIICLAENGVPPEAFKKLMHDGLHELVKSLTTWKGKNAMHALFFNIAKVGAVFGQRMCREFIGESRVKGYGYTEYKDEDEEDEDDLQIDPAEHERSTAWWDDQCVLSFHSLQAMSPLINLA